MNLFTHKLNPFTEFTINLGPLYVERLFDCLLTKSGIKELRQLNPIVRFEYYIELLNKILPKSHTMQYAFSEFYTAHFFHQISEYSLEEEKINKYRRKALFHYHMYLEKTNGSEESRYYAQWKTGLLQGKLNFPWSMVKDSLLKANIIDPLRGESVVDIIHHYMSAKEWNHAYTYSKFAKRRFFNKNPIAKRRWHVDSDSYNRNLLDDHIIICNNLGYWAEVEEIYNQLLNQVTAHLHEFHKVENILLK